MSTSKKINLNSSGIIEASAGTGKTYTITNLVIRLVLGFKDPIDIIAVDDTAIDNYKLHPIDLENILISTFTNAATEELKNRIYQGLINTRECFEIILAIGKDCISDHNLLSFHISQYEFEEFISDLGKFLFAKALIEKRNYDYYLKLSIRLLQKAESKIDLAAIKTMHGFCQSMLLNYAFESGAMFKTSFVQDEKILEKHAIAECYRDLLYSDDLIDNQPAMLYLYSDTKLHELLSKTSINRIDNPETDVVIDDNGTIGKFDKSYFCELYNKINELYHKLTSRVPWICENVDQIFLDDLPNITFPQRSKNPFMFNKGKLNEYGFLIYLKTTAENPENCIFNESFSKENLKELIDKLIDWNNQFGKTLKVQKKLWDVFIAQKIQHKKSEIKEKNNLLGFDDIIKNMHYAISFGSSKDKLVSTIRNRYPIAILDEFQDTDHYQYEIFKKIYLDNSQEHKCCLFVIGDPKQAIYAFRSADVYTYLEAKNNLGTPENLDTNYRSNKGLVDFVNVLFEGGKDQKFHNAFSRNDNFNIEFIESKSKYDQQSFKGKEEVIYCEDSKFTQISNLNIDADNHVLPSVLLSDVNTIRKSKNSAKFEQSNLAALHVSYLLTKCKIGKLNEDNSSREIKPSDIAILVSSKTEASFVKSSLEKLHIKSVYLSDQSEISQQEESISFFNDFMNAMLNIGDQKLSRKLLCNPVLQKSLLEIEALCDSAIDFGNYVELLRSCRLFWDRHNFMASFVNFITNASILLIPRVMSRNNGDRTLTDLFHIAEILQKQCSIFTSPISLKSWFDILAENKYKDLEDAEKLSNRIRLESQKDLVRIVTIHSSKGLEYPIVLMPFANEAKEFKTSDFSIQHINNKNLKNKLVLSILDYTVAKQEDIEEKIRLLYVGLTRARVLLWMDISTYDRATKVINSLFENKFVQLNNTDGNDSNNSTENNYLVPERITLEYFAHFLINQGFTNFNSLNFNPKDYIFNYSEDVGDINDYINKNDILITKNNDLLDNSSDDECCFSPFDKKIDRSWQITSFSKLNSSKKQIAKKREESSKDLRNDEEENDEEITQTKLYQYDRFHFPKGSKPGTFLHSILEKVPLMSEFTKQQGYNDKELKEKIKEQVDESFFASSSSLSKWDNQDGINALTDWFKLITETPLDFGDETFALNQIDPKFKLPEVKFTFSLSNLSKEILDDFLYEYYDKYNEKNIPEKERWVDFRKHTVQDDKSASKKINGFLSGIIDLFFFHNGKYYIVDYKSNYISDKAEDYNIDEMEKVVCEHRYDLQYAIYSLAAYRYLSGRIPNFDFNKDFGGVLYLFIRGLPDNPSKTKPITGCFYKKLPGNDFITKLNNIFSADSKDEE